MSFDIHKHILCRYAVFIFPLINRNTVCSVECVFCERTVLIGSVACGYLLKCRIFRIAEISVIPFCSADKAYLFIIIEIYLLFFLAHKFIRNINKAVRINIICFIVHNDYIRNAERMPLEIFGAVKIEFCVDCFKLVFVLKFIKASRIYKVIIFRLCRLTVLFRK